MADAGGQHVVSPYHAMTCNPVITIDPLGLQGQTSPGNIRSEHMVSPVWPRIPGYVDYQKKWADQYQAALEQMWADMQKRLEIYAALNSGNQAQVAFATMLINHANNSKINQAKNLLAVIIDMSNASSEYVPGSGEPPIGTMLREVKKTDFHIFTVKNKELSDYSLLKVQSPPAGCSECLDPSTVGKNVAGLTYTGPANPKNYKDIDDYSYVPKNLADYPSMGHDRRYDKLQITGLKGLLFDRRAISADIRFVVEEWALVTNPFINDPASKFTAMGVATGLGIIALPKMATAFADPTGMGMLDIFIGIMATRNIDNKPTIHKH